jgi:hypothetical protein
MQTLLQDLRYATRQLIRNLGLTITAVVSLALGIGATTAVFSVIYATLMNPYPYSAHRYVEILPPVQSNLATCRIQRPAATWRFRSEQQAVRCGFLVIREQSAEWPG